MSTEAICSKCNLTNPGVGQIGPGKTIELKYCYRCGGELVIKKDLKCSSCGLYLSIHDKFCQSCGKSLE